MIKKLSLLLCLLMVFSLVGCTDEKFVSSDSSVNTSHFENVISEKEEICTSSDGSNISITNSSYSSNIISSKTEIITESKASKPDSAESISKPSLTSSENKELVIPSIDYATSEDTIEIAQLIAEKINDYRMGAGVTEAVILPGLTNYAQYRSRQLVSNFSHNTKDERAAATALKYGQYIQPELFGMTGEPYYTANCGEAIAKADFVGTVEGIAEKFAKLAKNSTEHWSYLGSEQYRYIAVGITYENGVWYCCIAVAINNSDEQ